MRTLDLGMLIEGQALLAGKPLTPPYWTSVCGECGATGISTVSQADADAQRDAACTCPKSDE
jgi:hypothetical protein